MTYDGFFREELNVLEDDIESNHSDWKVFQGRKTIGELVVKDKPAAAIMLENAVRDPNDPNFGWVLDVTVTYIKYDASGDNYDALDDTEELMDEIDTFYEGTRDVSDNNVHGHLIGIETWSKPKDNGFVYGFVIKIEIKKFESDP